MKGYTYSNRFGREAPRSREDNAWAQQQLALMRPYFRNMVGRPRHWREAPNHQRLDRKVRRALPRGRVAFRLEHLELLRQDNTIEGNVTFDGEPWASV